MRKVIYKELYREMQKKEFARIESEHNSMEVPSGMTAQEFLMMMEKRDQNTVCHVNSKSLKRFKILRILAVQYAKRNAMDIEISENWNHDIYINLRFEFIPYTSDKSVLEKVVSLCDDFAVMISENIITMAFKIATADKYIYGKRVTE